MPALKAAFFDIGGTLGDVEPTPLKLRIFPDTITILLAMRALGLKLGVITNVWEGTDRKRVKTMLAEAGIDEFFDENCLITSTEAGCFKPATAIYLFAAETIRLPVESCVYVDTNPVQVAAAVAVGMHGIRRQRPRSAGA